MGFLNELRANPCVKGCPEDWSLHQMLTSCKSFFHALESEWIPTFFIRNEDRIKEDYKKQEGTDACFEYSPIVAYHEKFNDFSAALGEYITEMCGRDFYNSNDYEELDHLNDNIGKMLDGVFSDVTESSAEEPVSLDCLEQMIAYRNTIPDRMANIEAHMQMLEAAPDDEYAKKLASMYLMMETSYAVDMLEACEAELGRFEESMNPVKQPKAQGPKELQVF